MSKRLVRSRSMLCAAALFCLSACHPSVGSEKPLPGDVVKTGADAAKALNLPERPFDYQSTTLANGLQVITLEDPSTPIAAVQVWYHVGSKDEKPNRRGFAHMFEHMMFRGTQNIGPKAHFEYIRKVGGSANAFTSFDNTTYVQVVPSNQVEMVMWLEAERMGFLKINDGYFGIERKVVAEEFRMGHEAPYGTAMEKLLPGVFGEHPYRWSPIGDMNELAQANAAELQEFWNTYYVPNNAALVVVGDIKHAQVAAMAEKYFGWIPKYDEPPRVTKKEPEQSEPKRIKIKERNGPVPIVGMLYRTVPTGHKDELALEMISKILGEGESSRLWNDLVREQDLAMMAVSVGFALEQDGLFAAGAILSPFGSKPKKTLAAIRAQIESIRSEGVTQAELDKARLTMLRDNVTSMMSVSSKALRLGEAAMIRGDLESVNREFKEIAELTTEDLKNAAHKYLTPEHEIEVRIEPNLLGFLADQISGGKTPKATKDEPGGAEEISGGGEGKPGLVRPADLSKAPAVAPAMATNVDVETDHKTLANGLDVVVIPNSEVPFVTIWMGLEYGAYADPKDKPGTAYLALPMLARGTKGHDYKALTGELGAHAISLTGSADMDGASVTASALASEAELAMQLMAETVSQPTFPAEELEELVQQTVTGLMVTERSPQYLADRELRRRLFVGHPYERLPESRAADLHKVTTEDISAWWTKYARPDAATLYIAGDIDPAQAHALAKRYFGTWTAKGSKPEIAIAAPPKPSKTKIYLVDRSANQSQIRVGQVSITRSDKRYPAARVTTEYFGGNFNARLNDTIRVKKGLTYGASGGFSSSRFAGRFVVSTFSKNATVAETVRTILEEIERLKKEPASEKERMDAISYLVGSFAGARETPQAVIGDLWRLETQHLPADYYDRYLESVRNVTAEQTQNITKELVDSDSLVIVVVGPAKKLAPALRNIAEVVVLSADGTPKK